MSKKLARTVANYDSADSYGAKLRARRIAPLMEMIRQVHEKHGEVKLIDIGGTPRYWKIIPDGFLQEHQVRITLVNLPNENPQEPGEPFELLEGDACDLNQVGDQSYHIAHSNSVVEHVGDWNRMVSYANEVQRVSERYFVQTPNFWFPMEPHCMTPFFHWLPKMTRVWLVSTFSLGNWPKAHDVDHAVRLVESARLLNRKMMQALFPDAEIHGEGFYGLTKSFIAIKH